VVGQLLIKNIKSPKNPVAWGKCFYWSWTSCQKCSVHAWQLAILFTKTFPCANWFWNFMCPVSWSYQYIFCMIHRFCISWRASSFFSLSVIELRACIIFNYIVFFHIILFCSFASILLIVQVDVYYIIFLHLASTLDIAMAS